MARFLTSSALVALASCMAADTNNLNISIRNAAHALKNVSIGAGSVASDIKNTIVNGVNSGVNGAGSVASDIKNTIVNGVNTGVNVTGSQVEEVVVVDHVGSHLSDLNLSNSTTFDQNKNATGSIGSQAAELVKNTISNKTSPAPTPKTTSSATSLTVASMATVAVTMAMIGQ